MQIGYLSADPFASDEEQFTLTPEQKRAARIQDAAPEMLEALKQARAWSAGRRGVSARCITKAIDRAIAKAEG